MIDDLLALADELSRRSDVAARRRAISTAYYAAFHALCDSIAGALVDDRQSPLFEKIYRYLDHKHLDKEGLFDVEGTDQNATKFIRIGLRALRQLREEVDYAPFITNQTLKNDTYLANAQKLVLKIRSIDPIQRRNLALNILIGGGKARSSAISRFPFR